jgi:ribonucleoside-diphosphate reductase beta chain
MHQPSNRPHIQEATDIFKIEYPVIEAFTKEQLKVFWTADEIKVEKDVHDILTNCTESERHGIFTVLKLFSLYEMKAGGEYWTGRFMEMFKRHELQAMAATFGMFELAVHKPFYNKINELLNATDDTFYTDYVDTPVLRERMQFIDRIIDHPDPLVSLAGFSMVEGVILYSSFAFLKHFQSNGKNKLMNIVRGINFSVRDENMHSMAGAYCYGELKRQLGLEGPVQQIQEMAEEVYLHETAIIDMIFEKGEIDGITANDMKLFVMNRVDQCLRLLGIQPIFQANDHTDTVSEWFYKGINNFQYNDVFVGVGREYTRNWSEEGFVW